MKFTNEVSRLNFKAGDVRFVIFRAMYPSSLCALALFVWLQEGQSASNNVQGFFLGDLACVDVVCGNMLVKQNLLLLFGFV